MPRRRTSGSTYRSSRNSDGAARNVEYVSKNSQRKDYDDNYRRYEQQLKVPYYLLFYPGNEELSLFRLAGEKYVTVTPNAAGDGYTISVVSKGSDGTKFSITNTQGTVSRACDKQGKGGCPSTGAW